jgi:hypothetical protein
MLAGYITADDGYRSNYCPAMQLDGLELQFASAPRRNKLPRRIILR